MLPERRMKSSAKYPTINFSVLGVLGPRRRGVYWDRNYVSGVMVLKDELVRH
jgi:hypothetical protein